MTNCPKADCGAMIGEDGYCTRCGTAPGRAPSLDDLSADAIRAAQDSSANPDADDDRRLTTGAKRRGYKVRAILEKVSTAAAGGLIAHESAAVFGQLLG